MVQVRRFNFERLFKMVGHSNKRDLLSVRMSQDAERFFEVTAGEPDLFRLLSGRDTQTVGPRRYIEANKGVGDTLRKEFRSLKFKKRLL